MHPLDSIPQDTMTTGERIVRTSVRSLAVLVAIGLLAWPLDWLVWQLRVTMGGGMGSVVVSRFTVAELKGNKEDYYYEGSGAVDCSESLFAHAGEGTCWQLRKKPEVIVRY